MKHALLALAVLLLPLGAGAESPPPGADLVGRWILDPDRSDSIKPMMELMGAPWAVRQLVAGLRPTMTLSLTPDGLQVRNKTTLRDTDREIVADGEKRASKDALERTVTEWAAWQDDGTLKIWRKVPLEDGPVIEIEAIWRRNGEVVELDSVAESPAGSPLRTLRVFTPLEP